MNARLPGGNRSGARRPDFTHVLASVLAVSSLIAASPSPLPSPAAHQPESHGDRNDYAKPTFTAPLGEGLKHFYGRDFKSAEADFARALLVVPDNTFAISFYNASASQQPGELDVVTNVEEDASTGSPKNYVNHVRLGFTYMFESMAGRDRTQDAREELNTAVLLAPDDAAAHVGLGIMRFGERSANRAKTEMLAALRDDPSNVLAREYLGELYQTDLRDPQRGLQYVIDVPNLVPGYADIQFHIGSLLSDLGQPDAAITYYKHGIELDKEHVGEAGQHGYTALAQIYLHEHKTKDAASILQTAVDADVDTIIARTLLEKIKNGDYDKTASDGPPSPIPSGT